MLDPGIIPNAISSFQHVAFSPPVNLQTPQKDTKKKTKRKNKKRSSKTSKWADKCMYAELLEMSADAPWCSPDGTVNDGLPNDLESAWVAVAPVPVGKRCLAITHQSSGVAGVGGSVCVCDHGLNDLVLFQSLIQHCGQDSLEKH
jgi:snurportin-1